MEQAFELSDATAERSAAGCTISLSEESVATYLRSNVVMLRSLIDAGYEDARSLERRARAMERWLADPSLLRADADANYAAVIDIDTSAITEPLVACPNDPDDVRPLSEVAGRRVDEVFVGSCMTNIGHFRAAGTVLAWSPGPVPTRLWIAPPTRMDESQFRQEGYYGTFGAAGARTEKPGCSLCMGNQARVREGSTVFSTSTRNFPNRMGRGADVFLGSAELAAVVAAAGCLPSVDEYFRRLGSIDTMRPDVYRYLQFDKMPASLSRSDPPGRTRYPAPMCLLVFAWKTEPGYPLVVAANRDERLDRPAHSLCVLPRTRQGSSVGGTTWPGGPGWPSTSTEWWPG